MISLLFSLMRFLLTQAIWLKALQPKKSIGADGLIFGTPSNAADAFFTLFNSDGSQAEVSGNGLACFWLCVI